MGPIRRRRSAFHRAGKADYGKPLRARNNELCAPAAMSKLLAAPRSPSSTLGSRISVSAYHRSHLAYLRPTAGALLLPRNTSAGRLPQFLCFDLASKMPPPPNSSPIRVLPGSR